MQNQPVSAGIIQRKPNKFFDSPAFVQNFPAPGPAIRTLYRWISLRQPGSQGGKLRDGQRLAPNVFRQAAGRDGFDPAKPFETYTIDGKRVDNGNTNGIVIIRQGNKSMKIKR